MINKSLHSFLFKLLYYVDLGYFVIILVNHVQSFNASESETVFNRSSRINNDVCVFKKEKKK